MLLPRIHVAGYMQLDAGELNRLEIESLDHYKFVANCPPTPPLSQHFAPSEK